MKERVRALGLSVYYNPKYRACANGGITERFDEVLLVGICDETSGGELKPFMGGYVKVEGNMPENAVVLVKCAPCGGRVIFKLVPFSKYHDGKWYMFSGNYASTSDSRLGEAINEMGGDFYGALAVHDRTEE